MKEHTRAVVGHVEAHVIVLAPENAPLADVEEAIKAAARSGVRQARDAHRAR